MIEQYLHGLLLSPIFVKRDQALIEQYIHGLLLSPIFVQRDQTLNADYAESKHSLLM